MAAEKAAEQKQHAEQTAQFEAQIQALDSLRYDLEQAKANLTAKLELSSASNTALGIQIIEVGSSSLPVLLNVVPMSLDAMSFCSAWIHC